ncbi:hypothetical protein P152DRAFT_288957 [Eremomyces bilateralis CBS 781.70]|uniref:Uncharacterized protein n=1 Tax=Eremomyces bilateralis CBS 781.70 TaxID=1392243 RepID=A0A6G1G6P0_9PEZI|nr:uncharacterized protein P152DRAFT_288957 [Eremomyces bilateralis CBS 781.70]KAF1813694.1 hypothetical protein P152DRAFT_288957 [Eremomyces bilateralis CBS 781.70]
MPGVEGISPHLNGPLFLRWQGYTQRLAERSAFRGIRPPCTEHQVYHIKCTEYHLPIANSLVPHHCTNYPLLHLLCFICSSARTEVAHQALWLHPYVAHLLRIPGMRFSAAAKLAICPIVPHYRSLDATEPTVDRVLLFAGTTTDRHILGTWLSCKREESILLVAIRFLCS